MGTDERYEQLLAYIATHMPEPYTQEEIDGVVIFTGGSPGEVIVRLTDTSVVVDEYAVRWEAADTPVLRPRRVGLVHWRRVSESILMNVVGQLIRGAREHRLARYRSCAECGKRKPPESMAGEVCQSCARRAVGVVH
jgi:hypothetical protein